MSSTLFTQDLVVPTNVASASTSSVVKVPPSPSVVHGEKPVKSNGLNFKTWQQKMLFYFTTLNLTKFLTKKIPKSS
jgi:hypothetical protein